MTAAEETGGRASGLEALAAPSVDIPLPGAPGQPPAAASDARPPGRPLSSALEQAVALHRAGRHEEALAAYDRALQAAPGDPRIWVNMGVVLRTMARFEAAASCYRRAIALDPANAGIHSNLGNVLRLCDRLDEALACHRRALQLDPANHAADYNMALTLRDLGRPGEALSYFDRCIAGGHARPDVLVEHALTLLAAGHYAQGFARFEARLGMPAAAPAGSDAPVWDGGPLDGKSILVQAEAGTRDTLTFLRYVPALAARGAKVLASAPPPVARLIGALPGVAMVVPANRPAPATDLRVALNSLALLFATQRDTVPQEMPYLAVPPGRPQRQWLAPGPSGERKVGIVWSDRARDRAARGCPFVHFLRLAGIPGIALYRLQTGPAAAERDLHAPPSLVRDIQGEFADLADAAEAIAALDLVVGVDSAAVMLAGALGKPGMVVLPMGPDWRWAGDGDRSPWYPTLRLFRQERIGDWDAVFERVADALAGNVPPPAAPAAAQAPVAGPSVAPAPAAAQPAAVQPVRKAPAQEPARALPAAGATAPVFAVPTGPRQAVGRFLDEHLALGAILVEAGADGEGFAMGAVLRRPGQVRVIAVGTRAHALAELRRQAERAGQAAVLETLRAGLGARVAPALADAPPRTTLDALLAERRELAGRVFLCLGAGVRVDEAIAGAMDLIAQRRLAAIIWRTAMDGGPDAARRAGVLDNLARLGFGHFRLPDDDLGGKLMPYVSLPEPATVFSLSPSIERRAGYVGAPSGGAPLLEEPRYALLDAAQRRARTAALAAARGTDAARWADPANLAEGAEERARLAGPHLVLPGRAEATVLDLGAGLLRLERHLPEGTRYVPADLALRSADTVLVDLNQGEFPAGTFDAVAMLDVLEFVHDAPGLLQRARAASGRLVLSYRLSDGCDAEARAESGWFNAFTRSVLESHLAIAGWMVARHQRAGPYDLFVCEAADAGA